jgi:capsular exopolysaccharide synthesis family protein
MEETKSIDFYHYWRVFRRHWLPGVTTFGSVVVLTHVYLTSKASIYSAQGKLLFQQDQSSSLIKFDSEEEQQTTSSPNDRTQATEASVISSTPILQKALYRINIINQQGVSLKLEELQQGIEIESIEKTDILQVSYKSKEPRLAALVVDEVMKAYVGYDLSSSRAAAASAAKFISAQLPRVKANVYAADVAVRNFKEKNQITDLEQTQGSIAANIERIGSQVDSVEAQLADLNSRSSALQKKLGISSQEAIAMNSLSKSPVVQGVLEDWKAVQSKLADARSRYRESSPIIIQLKDKEAQLKNQLKNQFAQVMQGQQAGHNKLQVGQIQEALTTDLIKLEVDRVGLASQQATLSKQQALYQKKAATLPRLEQQLREAQRELSAAQSTYESLLKSLQEIKVIENRTVGNVRIIEAAQVPKVPINASKTSAMTAGSMAGILLAASVVYLLEKVDKRIKTVEKAKELFEYTLLATIPEFSKATKAANSAVQTTVERRLAVPVIESFHSSIRESYRMLHANLTFLNSDKALQVIVVTSSVPREGRSTTCANLAAVMAQVGYRVLIIDADLRCPSQHQIWQISNEVGLMDVIDRRGNLNETVIQKVMNNLYILTAGVMNSNSPVFIDSRSMTAFIERHRSEYDYVIFDTPSLAVAADAHILGKIADGVLLVTRPSIADSINSKLAKQSLDQSSQNILGIVVNGVVPENEFHSYHYYTGGSEQETGSREVTPHTRRNWLDILGLFRRS